MNIHRLGLLLVMAAAGLFGCSPAVLLDKATPEGTYTLTPNIPYGPANRQKLDLYRPEHANGTTVVFVYGGSWRTGDKAEYRFVAEALTRHGVTVMIPDYRLFPEVPFPEFVKDVAAAVHWTHERMPQHLFLMGHSAGAHIAALLTLDPRYKTSSEIAGFVGISGPYDFLPFSPDVGEVFAAASDPAQTQPITFAGPGKPPVLLLHGTADRTVYPRNSERLAAKLQAAGSPARLVLYPERGHVDIMLGLSSVFAGDGKMMDEILRFLTSSPRST